MLFFFHLEKQWQSYKKAKKYSIFENEIHVWLREPFYSNLQGLEQKSEGALRVSRNLLI